MFGFRKVTRSRDAIRMLQLILKSFRTIQRRNDCQQRRITSLLAGIKHLTNRVGKLGKLEEVCGVIQ